MSIQEDKQSLRRVMHQELALLSAEEKAEASRKICDQVSHFLDQRDGLHIASFAARAWEVDLWSLVQAYPQHSWYFPRSLDGRQLAFHRIASLSDLACGRYNILEPSLKAEQIEARHLDLVLVPGIAFTREGLRLGYGGGFYDAFLAQAGSALHLGVCFPIQVVDRLPVDRHDLSVHYLLTGQDATETSDACPSCGF